MNKSTTIKMCTLRLHLVEYNNHLLIVGLLTDLLFVACSAAYATHLY